MQRCLNPRKAHENRVLAQSEDATVALPDLANGQASSQQVACQYCKYLLEGALLGDSRLYVFGGLDANGIQQNDFWSYTKSSGWSAIQPATTDNPLGRQQGIGAWDSTNHVMYLMGGWQDGQPSPFYGLWVFDPHQNAWALLTPLDNSGIRIIPERTASAMVWDTTDHRAYIYVGAGNDKTHSSLNDLWMVN